MVSNYNLNKISENVSAITFVQLCNTISKIWIKNASTTVANIHCSVFEAFNKPGGPETSREGFLPVKMAYTARQSGWTR